MTFVRLYLMLAILSRGRVVLDDSACGRIRVRFQGRGKGAATPFLRPVVLLHQHVWLRLLATRVLTQLTPIQLVMMGSMDLLH